MTSRNPANDSPGILARRLISLTDLTSLNESDDAASVQALSLLACRSPVRPAAVCIWARFIPVVLDALRTTGIPVCAVANFPHGAAATSEAVAETAAAVAAGAAEVDVVFPYRALLAAIRRRPCTWFAVAGKHVRSERC
jgi:deoxyribose-phosphate aldolase